MVRKAGDVVIALIFLSFIVGAFSTFIDQADSSEDIVNSNLLNNLNNLDANSKASIGGLVVDLSNSVDNSSVTEVDPTQQIDDRNADTGGIMNILSKNVLVKFFNAANNSMSNFEKIFGLILTLIGVTTSILLLRFFFGEGKI